MTRNRATDHARVMEYVTPEKVNCCPKCKGTNGFAYNLIMKTNRSGDWGKDNDEETDVERIIDVKTVTCVDCGKRIDWNIAHGIKEANQ